MNEPSNFENGQKFLGCPKDGSEGALNHPPYTPRQIRLARMIKYKL
jgi:hypothetical protein